MAELLQEHGVTLSFDPCAGTVMAAVAAGDASATVDEAWLRARLAEEGWGEFHYEAEAAARFLALCQRGVEGAGLLIARRLDAQVAINIAPGGLEALLDVVPAQGGQPPSKAQVLEALVAKGVAEGYDLDAIDAAVQAGVAQATVVARGRAAVDGKDGRLETLLPEVRQRTPKVDELGHTDYRDLGEILAVQPGQALMRRHPPTAGEAGVTVQGLPLAARAGRDVRFAAKLSGTAFAPGDPDLLVAAVAGQPVAARDGMSIDPIVTVQAVTAATGHLKFDGSVVIREDVQSGMLVQVSGDIEVGGVVESATLEAGGNIVIKGGLLGGQVHKAGEEHHVRCGGSFSAGYAMQAKIEAGDSIFIDDTAIQCELAATNRIRIGHTKRGQIFGGKARAAYAISAKIVGAASRIATRLEINVNPAIAERLQALIKLREAKETQVFELSRVLDMGRKAPGKIHPDVIEKARKASAAIAAEIEMIRREQRELEAQVELSRQSKVIAEQVFHEGVEVVIGGVHCKINSEHGPGAIGLAADGKSITMEKAPDVVE